MTPYVASRPHHQKYLFLVNICAILFSPSPLGLAPNERYDAFFYILRACVPCQRRSFVYYTNTSLKRHSSFSQTGTPGWVDCLAHYGSIGVKSFFLEHNDALPISETGPKVNNLATANLHSYPISCTAASWDASVKGLSKNSEVVQW